MFPDWYLIGSSDNHKLLNTFRRNIDQDQLTLFHPLTMTSLCIKLQTSDETQMNLGVFHLKSLKSLISKLAQKSKAECTKCIIYIDELHGGTISEVEQKQILSSMVSDEIENNYKVRSLNC